MIKKIRRTVFFIIGLLFTMNWCVVCQAADTSDDGPHIFWQNDTTAVVFYFCDSEIKSKVIVVKDTLSFEGFCNDLTSEYIVPDRSHIPSPYKYENVSKIFAISDIHGDYNTLVEILINTGIIDSTLNWSFEDGHVVINGDLFDRGDKVTESLWLLYRLELEADQAGGKVHFILGNHELMVLRGDLRYVHKKYMEGIAKRKRFKYDELYGTNTEMGRWLRNKNTVEVINDILFLHGGIAPKLVRDRVGIEEINEYVRQGLDYTSVELNFNDTIKYLYGGEGPLWYRGLLRGQGKRYEAATTTHVDSLLNYYQVSNIVLGHTQMDRISLFHDGIIVAIDVKVEELGHQMALYWEAGHFYSVSATGEKSLLSPE